MAEPDNRILLQLLERLPIQLDLWQRPIRFQLGSPLHILAQRRNHAARRRFIHFRLQGIFEFRSFIVWRLPIALQVRG
ncbi:hypothetical protein D3C76_776000 [compost metagenome]